MALAVTTDGPSGLPAAVPAPPGIAHGVTPPRLAVVIVNFCQWGNTARLTRQLVRSTVVRDGSAEIVVVDNHSGRHPAARKLKRLPGVSVHLSERNDGFARAVNRGCRLTQSEWVLLLNPDVTVEDEFLDRVLTVADRMMADDPKAGVIGFQLRNRDGTRQASAGPFPTLRNTLGGLLRPRTRRKCRHRPADERATVPWVTGGCLLVRRDCFDRLGGLDEGYFLYYEDVDFCRRARALGRTVWYEPSVSATHLSPLHARRVPAPLRLITRHALLTYAAKHWPRWQTLTLAGMVWVEARLRQATAEPSAVECYRQLRRLIPDAVRVRTEQVAPRIRFAASFLNPIAAAQDRA